jgi:hypothetical protein
MQLEGNNIMYAKIESFGIPAGSPNLEYPTLQGLSFLLHHQELWPENFSWNYSNANNCAIGLTWQTWPKAAKEDVKKIYNISLETYYKIFISIGFRKDIDLRLVSFQMVADAIDEHLYSELSKSMKILPWFKNIWSSWRQEVKNDSFIKSKKWRSF